MESLSEASDAYLLERDIAELHRESKKWISEIALWRAELNFFQKLLDRYANQFTEIEDKKSIDHFQHLITYYTGELLDEFKQSTRRHEKLLANQLENSDKVDEAGYRNQHGDLSSHINSFLNEFNIYKKEFFLFIEKVI